MTDKLKLVTYCGLYCDLCGQRARIAPQADALRESMAKEGYEFWGKEIAGFTDFWRFLTNLADPEKACPGCRQDGGPPFCTIRKCAREKGLELCVDCEEYPCRRIHAIAEGYPTLLSESKRIKKIGIDAWIEEQKQRAETGFAYVDIRCHPYEVPQD